MSSLEDPNDPNIDARWQRQKRMFLHFQAFHAFALQASLAQNQPLPTDGSLPMASGYGPAESDDVVTLVYLQNLLTELGIPQ